MSSWGELSRCRQTHGKKNVKLHEVTRRVGQRGDARGSASNLSLQQSNRRRFGRADAVKHSNFPAVENLLKITRTSDIQTERKWEATMSSSPQESEILTVLIVDCLPLRNLGLVGVFDRISPFPRANIMSLPTSEAAGWLRAQSCCRMIIYNVGGDSLSNQKHLKGIRTLLRLCHSDTSLVVFSDNNTKEEVVSALNAGAHGFIFSGTDIHLARQALSFVLEGGSYFPAVKLRHGRHVALATTSDLDVQKIPALNAVRIVKDEPVLPCASFVLTERQKAVLGWLSRGDSNKTIARHLGIREGTVKVYVRQIMRKLGVVNRTQVAIAWTSRGAAENDTEKHHEKGESNGSGGSINGARCATGPSGD